MLLSFIIQKESFDPLGGVTGLGSSSAELRCSLRARHFSFLASLATCESICPSYLRWKAKMGLPTILSEMKTFLGKKSSRDFSTLVVVRRIKLTKQD